MNSIGLKLILDMGCICTKETIVINGSKYKVLERIAEGIFFTKYWKSPKKYKISQYFELIKL